MRQRDASPHTVAAYRDTMRLLLRFTQRRTCRQPSELDLADLDAPLVAAFLDHLEQERGNSVRTRNARLAAIHSLFRYAALRHPEHAALIGRVLAIPPKRFDRALVSFLSELEIDAPLASPDRSTWTGRRDYALLLLALETGLRASELTGLVCGDVHLGVGAHVSCRGKGRKERVTPLARPTQAVLRAWLCERDGEAPEPLFPTRQGRRLSCDALERRLAKHVLSAAGRAPTLGEKKVTLHVLRHTAAMRLLQAGVDTSVIALWLGHESTNTTHRYVEADLAMKEKALARLEAPETKLRRFRAADSLMRFLQTL